MKINNEIITSMKNALEKYPGVLPLHIFCYGPWLFEGDIIYLDNLRSTGLFDELQDELYEERKLSNMLSWDQEEEHIAEWVDKLSNHPELLSDAEKEWVKNNPEYKEIIIMEE